MCKFFLGSKSMSRMPFGSRLWKDLFVPLWSWKIFRTICLFHFGPVKYWNNMVCSFLLLKSFGIPFVCSSSFLQSLDCLCLFSFAPEKCWNTSLCSSLLLKSFGTSLFYPHNQVWFFFVLKIFRLNFFNLLRSKKIWNAHPVCCHNEIL